MVHADIVVAGVAQHRERVGQHGQLFRRTRQLGAQDAALRLEAGRQVGVGIERDAIGAQLLDLLQRMAEGFGRLLGQAVDQVDVDRLEADLARGLHQREHLLGRLHAMDRLLHRRIEVLHAEAQPVEAEPIQMLQALGRDGARIDLDRELATRGQVEMALDHVEQVGELDVAQESRRATAQVQLRHLVTSAEMLDLQLELAREVAQVFGRLAVVLGDDLVAGAVVAQRLAEGDMHIERERQRHRAGPALLERLDIVVATKGLDEAVGGRVRGVARPRHIEAPEKLLVDGMAHGRILQVWMRLCRKRSRQPLTWVNKDYGRRQKTRQPAGSPEPGPDRDPR